MPDFVLLVLVDLPPGADVVETELEDVGEEEPPQALFARTEN